MTRKIISITAGILIVVGLAWAAWLLTQWVYGLTNLPLGLTGKALEFPLWAALLGLVGNGLLKLFNAHQAVRGAFRTELFLKIGLVLMGAGISWVTLVTAAPGALLQGLIMLPAVFFFCWWLCGRFGLDEKLRAVMSTAVAVCGVSAAIAAAGAVLAKKEQVTYITTLVILVALPMMVIMPLIAGGLGLPQAVAGAWFGGNIDTTAAVVGAGTIYGETAQKIAGIVKQTQNAFIGVVAFLLALYASAAGGGKAARPSLKVMWDRFPKFVLGFILASILYSLKDVMRDVWHIPFILDGGKGTAIEAMKNWAFTLAFVCMGLELSVSEIRRMGWEPLGVFLLVTLFNTLLALGVAWVIFGGLFPVTW